MAVVGAAMVAAWSAGAGTAQAEEPTTVDHPSCEQLLAAVTTDEAPDGDPCEDPTPVDECGFVPLPSTEAGETTDGDVEGEDPCAVDVTVGGTGDCEDPESFTFTVDATGLAATTTYRIYLTSADLETLPEDEVPTNTSFDFATDAKGAVTGATHTSTEGDFDFPSGGFTLTYVVVDEAEDSLAYIDQTDVGECTPETQPGGTAPTPTPTPAPIIAPAPSTTVAPVVVTHPAVAQPAVLANTGTPVTASALLGGGLLVAGAGALVATRRRSS
jgi:LPXTG-motif cell wall-anchored protein